MTAIVPSDRRIAPVSVLFTVLFFLATSPAAAQGIGFIGGATVDPEGAFFGTHIETPELFQNLLLRPGLDGSFGGDFSQAQINIEIMYRTVIGNSGWSIYQGGGPAIVLTRFHDNVDVGAGSFFTFGFAHQGGFFTEFKYGGGAYPTLKFGAGFVIRKQNP